MVFPIGYRVYRKQLQQHEAALEQQLEQQRLRWKSEMHSSNAMLNTVSRDAWQHVYNRQSCPDFDFRSTRHRSHRISLSPYIAITAALLHVGSSVHILAFVRLHFGVIT